MIAEYTPKKFGLHERKSLIAYRSTGYDLGGAKTSEIGDQFFNEVRKREIGRKACLAAGCTHFLGLDCDEYYDKVSRCCEAMVFV